MRNHLLVLCLVVSGCSFDIKTCTTDADCAEGAGYCGTGGFCVASSDGGDTGGGTGGGTTTTGGGSGGGGGTQGGGTTTGGGGAPAVCTGVTCQPYEECFDDGGVGECALADFILEWVTPDAGAHFSGAQPIAATVRARRADQSTFLLDALPVTESVGDFSYSNGIWTGQLAMSSGAGEGPYQFTAGWPDAGRSATLTLMKDNTPPSVTLYSFDRPSSLPDPDPSDAGLWKKDETAIIRVDVVNGARPATASDILVDGVAAGALATPATCPSGGPACQGTCACFGIDLKFADLHAYRGIVSVGVGPVEDEAGNFSTPIDGGIATTRFKWLRLFDVPSGAELRPLALAADGRVIAGASNASGALGAPVVRLYVARQDGGDAGVFVENLVMDASTSIELVSGPLVTGNSVWVGLLRTRVLPLEFDSVLKPIPLDTMAGGLEQCNSAANVGFSGAMGLSVLSDGGEQLFAHRDGSLWVRSSNTVCLPQDLNASDATAAFSMVAFSRDGGSSEVFTSFENGDPLSKFVYAGTSWTAAGTVNLASGTQPRGLFAVGTDYVGGGGVSNTGWNFSLPSAGDISVGPAVSYTPATNAGPPAVGNGYVVFGSNTSKLSRIGYQSGAWDDAGTMITVDAGVGNLQVATPVIGEGGLVYFSGLGGAVTVRNAADLSSVWDIPALVSTNDVGQPALDKYRPVDGSDGCALPLGVFYHLSRSGTSARITATIVDSRGLDRTAPWPKYQRDNGNRGNPTLSLDAWSCP